MALGKMELGKLSCNPFKDNKIGFFIGISDEKCLTFNPFYLTFYP